MAKGKNLTLHIGQDYGVAMLPGEITETATVNFGRCQDEKARRDAKAFVRRFNSQPVLVDAGKLALEQLEIFALSIKDDEDLNKALRAMRGAIRSSRT
jgi:hypothetical protein